MSSDAVFVLSAPLYMFGLPLLFGHVQIQLYDKGVKEKLMIVRKSLSLIDELQHFNHTVTLIVITNGNS